MKEFYRRHLPHWQPRDAVFFVTFRLKNSLPDEVIGSLRDEQGRAKDALAKTQQGYLEEDSYFRRWDIYLDKAEFGPRWLSQPEIATIVEEALHYRDGKVFDLHAFCIMSNHVHVVFEPSSKSGWQPDLPHESDWQSDLPRKSGWQPDHDRSEYPTGMLRDHSDLHKIMQSLKRHTARQANMILGREGAFWQDESYDRVIRDGEEYARIIHYVLENPVQAGLVSKWDEWQWTYCSPDVFS